MVEFISAKVWLSTIPEGCEIPRSSEIYYDYPDIAGGEDLVDHLSSIGFSKQGLNGLVGMDWSDIHSWQNAMGLSLTPWEMETLHKLSDVHAKVSNISKNKDCPAPWVLIDKPNATKYDHETDDQRNERVNREIFG